MENLKQLLLNCQLHLQQENWDSLLELLEAAKEQNIEGLDLETAKECLAILEHLIAQAEEKKNKIANSLVNLKKLGEGYRF